MRTLLVAGMLLCLAAPLHAAAGEDLLASREKYFTPRVGDVVPGDLAFRDELGKPVKLGDYFATRPVILVPAWYRCPRLCTLVLNDLVKSLRSVPATAGKDFEVVVVSFDPREKPDLARAKKEAYAQEYGRPGAEAGWHFLTGEQKEIDVLLESVGFRVIWDEKKEQYVHARGILLVSPGGKVSRYFLDGDYPSWFLRLGLRDAAEGKIGSIPDQVLLMCFSYDPETGKYSASVFKLLRVGAVLTLISLAGFWLVSWRVGNRASGKVGRRKEKTGLGRPGEESGTGTATGTGTGEASDGR